MKTWNKLWTLLFLCGFGLAANAVPYYALSTDLLDEDESRNVQFTPMDGGSVSTGLVHDTISGKTMVNIVKYDPSGGVLWAFAYDFGPGDSWGNAIEVTSDGGYIVAGAVLSPVTGMINAMLLKVDPLGFPMWAKFYDYSSPYAEAHSVEEVPHADIGSESSSVPTYVWTGETINAFNGTTDLVTVVTDPIGAILFTGIYDSGVDEAGTSVKPRIGPFGVTGYVVSGWQTPGPVGGTDAIALEFDPTLSVFLWSNVYGGPVDDVATSVEILPSGESAVTGFSNSFSNGRDDIFTSLFDPFGAKIWSNVIGHKRDERALSIEYISDNSLVVAGWTNHAKGGRRDAVMAKMDLGGTLLWGRAWGLGKDDMFHSVKEVPDSTGFSDLLGSGIFGADLTAPADDRDLYNVRTDLGGDSACPRPVFIYLHIDALCVGIPDDPGVFGYCGDLFPVVLPLPIHQADRCCTCAEQMPSFVTSSISPCVGDVVTFTNTSSCIERFRWSVNGTVITYADNMTYTFTAPGTYTIELAGKNPGCPAVFYTITIVVSCSPRLGEDAGEGQANTAYLSVRPNPARDLAWVDLALDSGAEEALLRVTDLAGRTLTEEAVRIDGGRVTHPVDLSGLPEGVYLVEALAGETRVTTRLAVAR